MAEKPAATASWPVGVSFHPREDSVHLPLRCRSTKKDTAFFFAAYKTKQKGTEFSLSR